MKRLFGTDGIRGIANQEPMTPLLGLKLGVAIGKRYGHKDGFVCIGRDTRQSGPMLQASLASGLLSSGLNALSLGVIPTAAVAHFTAKKGAVAGVMVSASHNPWNHNGFKVFSRAGEKLNQGEERALETLIHHQELLGFPEVLEPGTIVHQEDATQQYVSFLLESVSNGPDFKDIKLVIDCANGAAYKVAPILFDRLETRATVLFANPDGRNINEGCGSEQIEALAKAVVKEGALVGLAFDGDADRLIAIDERGREVSGDQLLAIFSKMLKDQGRLGVPLVVSTVMSNLGLKKALQAMGVAHVDVPVGDRNVYMEMKKRGALLGGEDSGHIIFREYHTTGDGILSGLMLLQALVHFNKPLSELSTLMTPFPQVLINVPVSSKPEISSVPQIQRIIHQVEQELGDNGRVLVRYSGTEAVCRVMVEGEDNTRVEQFAREIAGVISQSLGSSNK